MRHEHNNNDVIFQQKRDRDMDLLDGRSRTHRGAAKTKIQNNVCACTPKWKIYLQIKHY